MPSELFAPLAVLCAAIVLFRYYQIGRLASGFGWSFVILAIGGFGSGLATAFAWSGFTFLFLGSLGVVIVVQDALFRLQARRNHRHTQPADPD